MKIIKMIEMIKKIKIKLEKMDLKFTIINKTHKSNYKYLKIFIKIQNNKLIIIKENNN